jgi:hypothetical protein
MIFGPEPPSRRNFPISVKKIEWLDAAKADVGRYLRDKKYFVKTSYCRKCKIKLTWGDRTYEFDHKDNNNSNNSQKNCYLVCRNCHGKATKVEKRAIKDVFGSISGYQTIKRKVSYKKPKTTVTKRVSTNKSGSRRVAVKKAKSKSIKK